MVLDNPSCVNRCLFIAKVSNGQISDSTTHVTLSKSWLHAVITNYFSHTYGYLQPSAFGKNMLPYSVIFSLLDKSQDEPENEDKPTELAVPEKEDEKSMKNILLIYAFCASIISQFCRSLRLRQFGIQGWWFERHSQFGFCSLQTCMSKVERLRIFHHQ